MLYSFAGLRLCSRQRLLLHGVDVVSLTPEALSILIVLVERAGEVVGREALRELVWGDSFVEDAVVTRTISLLRTTLAPYAGAGEAIQTLSKRGYRFGLPITFVEEESWNEADSRSREASQSSGSSASAPVAVGLAEELPAAQDLPKKESQDARSLKRESRRWLWAGAVVILLLGCISFFWGKGVIPLLALASGRGKSFVSDDSAVSIATVDRKPTPVGVTSQQQTAITFPSRIKLNPTLAVAIQVVTEGVPNADFRYAPGGTCEAGKTYSAGDSCTVNYAFSPQTSGQRKGAILLQNDSSELEPAVTTFISRTGTGASTSLFAGTIDTILGGPANLGTSLSNTEAIAIDAAGVLFVADTSNQRVLKVSNGMISQYGPEFADPTSVALDGAGNVYVAEWGGSDVRIIDHATGRTSVAPGSVGLHHISCVTLDGAGNLYVSVGGQNVVLRIPRDGAVRTIAGTGAAGFNGDDIRAARAQLHGPSGLVVDESGNVYFEDTENDRVRKVDTAGMISTIAGTGEKGFNGDGGLAIRAEIARPSTQLLLDGAGDLIFGDYDNERIRKISAATSVIRTVVGNGTKKVMEDVPATATGMVGPGGLAFDCLGNLYVAENGDSVVRRVAAQARPQVASAK